MLPAHGASFRIDSKVRQQRGGPSAVGTVPAGDELPQVPSRQGRVAVSVGLRQSKPTPAPEQAVKKVRVLVREGEDPPVRIGGVFSSRVSLLKKQPPLSQQNPPVVGVLGEEPLSHRNAQRGHGEGVGGIVNNCVRASRNIVAVDRHLEESSGFTPITALATDQDLAEELSLIAIL